MLCAENGSFEESTNSGKRNEHIWNQQDRLVVKKGDKSWEDALAPWVISNGSVVLMYNGGWGYAQDGYCFLDTNGLDREGAIEQVRCNS
jgi:hypothetical protein